MRVADFFCGGGGFSEGFRQAGFNIVFAVDKWEPAITTYKGNKPVSEAGFFWSKNEYEVARLLATDYYLYLIDLTKICSDNYEPEIINNPAQQITENSMWLIEPQSYHVQKIIF